MLQTTGLTKRYGAGRAAKPLAAPAGRAIRGFAGPNGAGKSTLFQVLTGLFAADEGEVEVAGRSLGRSATAALRHIGVVFQQVSLDLDLSIRRNLLFQATCTACRVGSPRPASRPAVPGSRSTPISTARCESCRVATGARSNSCARRYTGNTAGRGAPQDDGYPHQRPVLRGGAGGGAGDGQPARHLPTRPLHRDARVHGAAARCARTDEGSQHRPARDGPAGVPLHGQEGGAREGRDGHA